MKRKDPFSILTCLVFLALVCTPVVIDLWAGKEDTAALEKRSMAQMPGLNQLRESFSGFATLFDSYYGDSFGLRAKLIRWNNLLRIGVFNESPIKDVRLGKDGWLYYANEWDLEDFENVLPYKSEDLQKVRTVLGQRQAWLANRGIKFFVMIAPNKHTIYPEFLPPYIHKIGKESRLDQVAASLQDCREIEFVDIRDALTQAKPIHRLYHRTDTHWNDFGAFVGYRELIEHIGRTLPNVRKLSLEDFTVLNSVDSGGDLARLLSLSDEIKEESIRLIPRFTPKAADGTRDYPDPVKHLGREMVVKETGDATLPKALVFRDSFSWPLIPYLAESFRSVVFIWTFEFLPEIIEREKPDVVILEAVERYLNALTIDNPKEVSSGFLCSRSSSARRAPESR